MTSKPVRQLSSDELTADEEVIIAVKNLANYQPAPGLPTKAELVALNERVAAAEEAYLNAQNALAVARTTMLNVAWDRHDAVVRTKAYVVAVYGRDSNEVQAVGLKRQIDRKRPMRQKVTP